jgi:hypothetical protein
MELMSLDPSMSAQLAGASINAAKGLFSKKVRRVKGELRNGQLAPKWCGLIHHNLHLKGRRARI